MERVLIAASGTGGHLFPALYIAKELERLYPEIEIQFCGSGRPLEKKIIGPHQYRINVIPIVGVSRRGVLGFLQFLMMLPKALLITYNIIRFTKPDAVIGVGGYVSVLPILIARMKKIKTLIHEAERQPGLANRFLSYIADQATVAYTNTTFPGKVPTKYTGQPVNPALFDVKPVNKARIENVLVLGGSQGSDALDKLFLQLEDFIKSFNINIIHQCRSESIHDLMDFYERLGVDAQVVSFIEDMPVKYQWADLVVTRSGLNTVRELEVVKRPAIFVPLPKAPEQMDNARKFMSKYPAVVVQEGENMLIDFMLAVEQLDVQLTWPEEERKKNNAAAEIAQLVSS